MKVILKHAIQDFLACIVRWTPCWFNKPKFHLLLHLPEHICHFGPASLFATEGFESYNAVIRAKSVHSNCQAPSHDIVISFAHANRVRHFLSGAHIMFHEEMATDSHSMQWQDVGEGPGTLVAQSSIITHYLGLDSLNNQAQAGK